MTKIKKMSLSTPVFFKDCVFYYFRNHFRNVSAELGKFLYGAGAYDDIFCLRRQEKGLYF